MTSQTTQYRAVRRGSLRTEAIGTLSEIREQVAEKAWSDMALYSSLKGRLAGLVHLSPTATEEMIRNS